MLNVELNSTVPLRIMASDGNTGLYGQVRIYDSAGDLIDTLNTTHIGEGLYSVDWTPDTEGWYSYIGQLYTDSGRTIDAGYDHGAESVDVNSTKTNILRILGLQHSNSNIDMQVFDGNGNLTSARIRCYDTKAHAQAADVTGLLFSYSVAASYTNGLLNSYTLVQDS